MARARPLLLLAASLDLLACAPRRQGAPGGERASAGASRPNVMIVVLDTLRYDATGLDGRTGRMPFLGTLAARGIQFSRAYSTHDYTAPSHFSLLTGFVDGEYTSLDRPEYGLPHQLERLGYATFGAAANGMLSPNTRPVLRGFHDYVDLYDNWTALPEDGKRAFQEEVDARIAVYGGRRNTYNRTMVFSSWAHLRPKLARMIRRWAPVEGPFFGFVNIIEPHDPYFPDPDALGKEGCGAPPPGFDPDLRFRPVPPFLAQPQSIQDPGLRRKIEGRIARHAGRAWVIADDLSPEQLTLYRCRYDAEAREADRDLEQIFDLLEQERLLDSTVVVVTSDHGESFGEAGLLTHQLRGMGDVEALQRVPLVILLPRRFGARPARVDEPVTIADVPPTIYDLLGVDWRGLVGASTVGNYGRSLLPYLGVASGAPVRSAAVALPAGVERESRPTQGKPTEEAVERLRALGYVQ